MDDELRASVYDARRIILSHRFIIQQYPLEAYFSTVLFSPQESLTRKAYLNYLPQWIIRFHNGPQEWSDDLQILDSGFDSVTSVVFSPDRKVLASVATANNTVNSSFLQMWDPLTGELRSTWGQRMRVLREIVFSSDGKLLAMELANGSIQLWEVATGRLYQELLKTPSTVNSKLSTLRFSSDDKRIAYASTDAIIRTWSLLDSEDHSMVQFYADDMSNLAFSPSSQLLVTISRDGLTQLWETKTGDWFKALTVTHLVLWLFLRMTCV